MNIKNFALTGLLFSSVVVANAQQKLSDGTGDNGLTVNQNAILELASKNKGLLHTRVTLEATAKAYPMSAHVAGLMVYNTETRNDVVPGIYYNDGTKWVLASGGKATSISYNPTTYEISFVDATGGAVTIDFKEVVKKNETVTTLVPLGEGRYEYTSENGTKTLINVPSDVIQNFETIVKEENVKNEIVNLIKNIGGNVFYDGAKFTYVTNTGETKEITIKEIVQANETVTTLIKNGDGTYTYTSENGTKTIVDIPSEFIENFNTIVKQAVTVDNRTFNSVEEYIKYVTETKGGFTKIVYDQTTGDVIFQEWDASTNTWVNVDNKKFETIVTANESKTEIITVDNKQYYISEAYLSANDGKVPSTVDPANLPAGVYAIDVVGGVVNNFEEIVQKGPITVDGRTFPTINDYITYLTETTGGFTKIVYDQSTGDAIFQEWDASTNTWVNVDNKKFETIVAANESKTEIITVDNKQYYISEAYLSANDGKVPSTVDPANLPAGVYAIDVVGGVVNNFEEIVQKGPITVDGRTFPTINDYITYLTETTGGFTKIVYDQSTGDAIFQEWNETTQQWVNVDNKKFETIVKSNETVTNLVENTNGTFTYYNEEAYAADGTLKPGAKGVDIDPSLVNVIKEGNKYIFKDNSGKEIVALEYNAGDIVYNDNTTKLGATNVQGAIEKLIQKITAVEGTKGELTVAGGIEFTNGDGKDKLLADAGIQIANQGVTTEKLADKNVTADKLTAGTGKDGRVAIADGDGNVTYTDAIPSTSISGKDVKAGSDKVILGGIPQGAALKEFSVDVDETKLNLNANQIKGGTEGKIIIADQDGRGQWVDKTAATENLLVRTGNDIKSTVNGKESTTTVIGTVTNTVDGTKLTTSVNGIAGEIDLKDAIQEGQKETVVKEGVGTKVAAAVDAEGKVTTYTVSADPATIALDGDVTGNAGATTISKIQGKELVAQNPVEGNVLVFEGGKWITKTASVDTDNVTNGKKLTGTGITVTGGDAALLKDANVAIAPGKAGQVMVTTADEQATEWKNLSEITTETVNDLKLEGNKLTSTVNGKESFVTLTDANLTSNKKIESSNITVTGGQGATLQNVTLEVTAGTNGQVMVTKYGKTAWVDQSTIVPATTNELSSTGNTMTSNVNGVSKEAVIVNEVKNDISGTTLTTSVNGIPAAGVDLKSAIQAGQKITEVVNGVNTTVTPTVDGNITKYAVNVSKEAIQADQKTTTVTKGSDKVTVVTTGVGTTANNTEYTVDVDEAKLSLQNIGGKVTNNQITTGKDGQVLVTEGTTTKWVDQSTIVPVTTNELKLTDDDKLTSTVNGVTSAPAVDLAKYLDNKDEQKLKDFKVIGTDLSITIEGGNTVTVPLVDIAKLVDTDMQQISELILTGNILKIVLERGGEKEVDLSTLKTITYLDKGTNTTVTGDGTATNKYKVNVSKEAIQAAQKTTVVAAGDGVTVAPPVVAGDVTTYTVSVKELKATMPKFFYMPSIIIPTHSSQVAAPSVFGSIDLYALYQKQFGTPMRSNSNKSTTLPVLPKNELDYYITWFDESVFDTVNVNGDGVMTYTVKSGADISVGSFMNIVFAVRL